jgi:hypothetical protein
MDEVKLTPEEEAIVSGEGMDDMERPLSLGESLEVKKQQEAEAPDEELEVAEVETEQQVADEEQLSEEDAAERLTYAERANKGLLKEIKKLRESNRGYRSQWNELQARLAGIEEKLDPKQEEETDPEWILWKQKQNTAEQLDKALEPQKEEVEAKKAAQIEAQKDAIIHEVASTSEREAFEDASESEVVEYQAKMSQLRDAQFADLVQRGMPEQQAYQTVLHNERDFIEEALTEGSNPALKALEIYDKQGFKLADYEPWVEYSKQSDSPTGEEQSPEEAQPISKKIEAVRKGQQGASLSTHSGGPQRMTITYDQFADMDPEDPIAAQIYASEKKLSEISITGKTNIS